MTQPIGNEEQMAQIKKAMETHQRVQQGGKLKEGTHINYTSMDGTVYEGWVVFKRLNMGELMKAGGIKSEILRQSGVKDLKLVDDEIAYMAHVISMLSMVLVKRPEWLMKLHEVTESDILYHVFGKYEEWENSFRKPIQQADNGDSEASDGEEAVDTSEARVRGTAPDGPADSGDDEGTD